MAACELGDMGIRATDDLARRFTAGQRVKVRQALARLLSSVPIWGDWSRSLERRERVGAMKSGYRKDGGLVALGAEDQSIRNDILRLRVVLWQTEQMLHDEVHLARARGWSWEQVADATGHNSASAAYRYFGTESPEASRKRERDRRRKTQ